MPTSRLKSRAKKPAERVLALPNLEQAKAAVLNSLTSARGQHVRPRDVALLLGCGLRRGEVLGLELQSVQQREEHWSSLICWAKPAMSGPSRYPTGSRPAWTLG